MVTDPDDLLAEVIAQIIYTTQPSLKIGKQIATTRPPISTSRITIINGFISDESAVTALPSMVSSEPNS